MRARILVLDEPKVAKQMLTHLQSANYTITVAADADQAFRKFRSFAPDLVILNWALRDADALEICKRLRNDPPTSSIRVLVIGENSSEIDRVLALEVGADDFLSAPFNARELILRVKKQLQNKRGSPPGPSVLKCGEIVVDVDAYLASVDGKAVDLTTTEFKLLQALLRRLGRVVTRQQLLDEVWPDQDQINSRTVDTHMARLRQKLGRACRHLTTLQRVGYRAMEV